MATLTATALTLNTASANLVMSGGTAFTDATTLDVAFPQEGKLLIIINSTYAGANTATIGTGADYIGAGVGTITVTTAQNGVYYIVVSSSRTKVGAAGAGTVNIIFGTSNTGFVRALTIP